MRKGISTWLFTKVVMLIFLTMTFAIIMSFTSVVQQRSKAEAAQQIAINVKDSTLSLLGVKAQKAERFVRMPGKVPEETEEGEEYSVRITKEKGNDFTTVTVAIALGLHEEPDEINYLTATSFKVPNQYAVGIEGNLDSEEGLLMKSTDYQFTVIELLDSDINIWGCKEDSAGDCLK